MTNPEALAKLIYNAPELAGEVMPEVSLVLPNGLIYCDHIGEQGHRELPVDQLPTWFYQAVAGNLAEWLDERGWVVRQRSYTGGYMAEHISEKAPPFYCNGNRFAALVEAAIAVHNAT